MTTDPALDQSQSDVPTAPEAQSVSHSGLAWTDVDGVHWQIELAPTRILLHSGDTVIDLPADSWSRDVYTAEHGQQCIVRFDTYNRAVNFLVPNHEAAPLVEHVAVRPRIDVETPDDPEPTTNTGPLLWPKVSPFAVWALACSCLAFIPVVGLIPAIATVLLLIKHRTSVRRSAAFGHSRRICAAACLVLVLGLGISTLAVFSARHNRNNPHPDRPAATLSAETNRNWGVIGAGILVVLLSLTVHEAAHAVTALWLGDGLARSLGRVTLNPLAHIDPFGTILLPLLLVMSGSPAFGYARPVPVRVESLPRHRRAHILISIAGPGSNMILAAISLMLLLAIGCLLRLAAPNAVVTAFSTLALTTPIQVAGVAFATLLGGVCTALKLSFIINTALAVFNMIPIPPLDGSWVLQHTFPLTVGRLFEAIRPYGFMVFIGLFYAASGLGIVKYLFIPMLMILGPGLSLLDAVTGW